MGRRENWFNAVRPPRGLQACGPDLCFFIWRGGWGLGPGV
jgi:hypothetical protein